MLKQASTLEDAREILADCGEDLDYVPVEGSERAILGLFEQMPPDGTGADHPQSRGPVFHLRVVNDSSDGIAETEVQFGKDKVSIPARFGGTAGERPILDIIPGQRGNPLICYLVR